MTTTLEDQPANEFEEPTERYAVLISDDFDNVDLIVYTCWTEERGDVEVVRTYERTEEGLLADPRHFDLVVADDFETATDALGEPGRPVAMPVSVARDILCSRASQRVDQGFPSRSGLSEPIRAFRMARQRPAGDDGRHGTFGSRR